MSNRVALIHPYLINQRGGERVLYALSDLYPDADIFTLVYDPSSQPINIKNHRVISSFVTKFPLANHYSGFKLYTPFFPLAVESFDLRDYDIVISSSSAWVHGALSNAKACHICYMHNPFRFAWDGFHSTLNQSIFPAKVAISLLMNIVRIWDFSAAQRVDKFIANSKFTQQKIRKFFRRDSFVIHPPVQTSRFSIPNEKTGKQFILVSSLVPYKRIDIAVTAFTALEMPLKIVGKGPDLHRLSGLAGHTIEFLPDVTDEQVANLLSESKALIFTSEEDFGIVPLEAQASGCPVLAFRGGGALETVQEGVTGEFFNEQTSESLIEALKLFQPDQYNPIHIREWAMRFDVDVFKQKIKAYVDLCWNEIQL